MKKVKPQVQHTFHRKSRSSSSWGRIDLKPGSDPHRLVVRLIGLGVCPCTLMAATGQSKGVIAAIKAHVTMGTYGPPA